MNKQPSIHQTPADWQAGFNAGAAGLPQSPVPAGITDQLAYFSGWIEGNAQRGKQ